MVFQRKLAESILDRFLVGIAGNTKDFVIVTLGNFSDMPPPLSSLPELGIDDFLLRCRCPGKAGSRASDRRTGGLRIECRTSLLQHFSQRCGPLCGEGRIVL